MATTQQETMANKVDKLEIEMQQCTEALCDIRETLAAMIMKQGHITLVVLKKEETKRTNGSGSVRNGALQPQKIVWTS